MSRGSIDQEIPEDISLKEAVEMGEYDPKYLANFEVWNKMSKNMQWQTVRRALKNRRRLLETNYAEIFNQLDFSKKEGLKVALGNVERQINKLNEDEDSLLLEYSDI